MIGCLLMVMVRDDCLLVNGNITINKQTIISHHYHQQTNSHISPLPSTNNQSSLTITINKQSSLTIIINKQIIISHHYHQQTIISHHYHQQTNNYLSPLTSESLNFGSYQMLAMTTPGHTDGCMSYVVSPVKIIITAMLVAAKDI
jgi:acetyltransferase-like isoleucine patch superfamily enzyme